MRNSGGLKTLVQLLEGDVPECVIAAASHALTNLAVDNINKVTSPSFLPENTTSFPAESIESLWTDQAISDDPPQQRRHHSAASLG